MQQITQTMPFDDSSSTDSTTVDTARGLLLSTSSSSSSSSTTTIVSTTPLSKHAVLIVQAIKGMHCGSCTQAIRLAVSAIDGVEAVDVSLELETATVTLASITSREEVEVKVKEAILDCGFDVEGPIEWSGNVHREKPLVDMVESMDTREIYEKEDLVEISVDESVTTLLEKTSVDVFHVKGMTCASCVHSIESALLGHENIRKVEVSLIAETAKVTYSLPLNAESIATMIQDCGFEASHTPQSSAGQVHLKIFGMSCASCVHLIDRTLRAMPGIEDVAINLSLESGKVTLDHRVLGVRAVVEAIEGLGFKAVVSEDTSGIQMENLDKSREIAYWRTLFHRSTMFAVPVFVLAMIMPHLHIPFLTSVLHYQLLPGLFLTTVLQFVLTLPVQFGIGKRFYINSYRTLRHGAATMDVLIALGTTAAFLYSLFSIGESMVQKRTHPPAVFFDSCTMLIAIVAFGRYLKSSAKGKTSTALAELVSLRPNKVVLLVNEVDKLGKEREVEKEIGAELLQVGDKVKIFPGDAIPADGVVVSGESTVDESMITGESMPVKKGVSSEVMSGTMNERGVLVIKTTRVGHDSTLGQIVSLVANAQMSKAPTQEYADKVASIFVPTVVLLSVLTFSVWFVVLCVLGIRPAAIDDSTGQFFHCMKFCISVLVAACPCALGLATPTAIMAGTGVGARLGILIKGGECLEKASQVTHVVFDKTGTLTKGEMRVVGFHVRDAKRTAEFLRMVHAAESCSEHPLGRSFVEFVKQRHSHVLSAECKVEAFEAVPGRGLECRVRGGREGQRVVIGNAAWMEEQQVTVEAETFKAIAEEEQRGHTVVLVAIEGALAGTVAFADELKPEAKAAVAMLHRMGKAVSMITGDQRPTALALAAECGIPPERVHAGCTPAGKAALLARLQEHDRVAMVGDGINDAPALATAHVGIALRSGSDIAISAASVVLLHSSPLDVPVALDLTATILRRIRFNFIWASLYNLLTLPLAMGLFVPWHVTLPPMAAGVAMALSSASVVSSSLALYLYSRHKVIAKYGPAPDAPSLLSRVLGALSWRQRNYRALDADVELV